MSVDKLYALLPARTTGAVPRQNDFVGLESGGAHAESSSYMFTVYVLQDQKTGLFYKGMTNNLHRRLREHQLGHTKTTAKMKNLVLVYQEKCDTFDEARKREIYFKSAAGRRFLKKVIPANLPC